MKGTTSHEVVWLFLNSSSLGLCQYFIACKGILEAVALHDVFDQTVEPRDHAVRLWPHR